MDELNKEVNKRKHAYQRRAKRYYNKKVRSRSFLPGDLVCRKLEAARPSKAQRALAPNWEDPVQVSQSLGNGAYKLKTLDRELIPRTWNAEISENIMSEYDVMKSTTILMKTKVL